jgi:polyvinyl alcohol dehydrogenase (cytochrome)
MPKLTGRSALAVSFIILFTRAWSSTAYGQESANPGDEVYAKHCAACHDQEAARAPSRSVLQQRTSAYILKVLNTGIMKEQAAQLSPEERSAVALMLGRKTAEPLDPLKVSNHCKGSAAIPAGSATPSWTSWGGGIANLRFQSAAAAGLTPQTAGRLRVKWAFGVPDVTAMQSQPAVYEGNVLFGGGTMLYSVDAVTGCTHWTTELPATLRSGLSIGTPGGRKLAFFGDNTANVHAVDIATGTPVWQTHADSHHSAVITGTPLYHDGKLYVTVSSIEEVTATVPGYVCCTFRGSILALDAASGKILWQTYTIDQPAAVSRTNKLGAPSIGPSGAGVWSAPTLDLKRNMLYVGTGDNYSDPATDRSDAVLALALDTGKIVWSHQFLAGDAYNVACHRPGAKNCPDAHGPDFDFGASPILLSRPHGNRVLLLAQKSGAVYALDPDNDGKLLWKTQLGTGGVLGGIEWGPATDSDRLYVAISDVSFFTTGGIDPSKGGGLFALSLDTGKQVWSTPPSPCDGRKSCSPAQTAAITAIPGVVFSGSVNGHIRAHSAVTGGVLWDFDTGRGFETVNGVEAHGGSISVAGPVVVDGTLYLLSGYDKFGEAAGNILLAFRVD